jgi:microcystin-dependent protein
VGTIISYTGTYPPNGWLKADGSSVLRSSYPALFALIGTSFGAGSVPGTTFALPDYRGTTGIFIIRATDDSVALTTSASLIAVPVGSLQLFAMTSVPTGWVRADGSAFSRTAYADLFASIGTTYGSGDGSTTFNVPNITGSGAGSPLYYIKAILSGDVQASTVAHASSHIRTGSDIIDGDRIQIDYSPTYYTRDSSDANAGANTDLTAHLKGIDSALIPFPAGNYLVANSNAQITGPTNGNLIYTSAGITLTAGSWMVQSQMSLLNTATTDVAYVALYNNSTSSQISNSWGAQFYTFTTQYVSGVSNLTLVTVASNTVIYPYAIRNGGSTIRCGNSGATGMGNSAATISAFKLKY